MGLLESKKFNTIIIYVNWFIKIRYFIFIRNNITAQDTTLLFINNIYAAHRFPDTIISDHGP